ncbi:MAG: Inositol 2-dehydrogenase/D-chiro-inositol 3-dehydrogenase [Verrucomicrobiae bacterium]|nr:Inositol 2-dehydrogenase/D-chiro-inositol 3-dehydrogenase [Verrucomicrobiae bacterium]
MKTYRVIVVGMGKRGMHHATTFVANPRFQLVGICDIDQARLAAAAPKLGNPKTSTDAAALAKEVKADLFCFCTLPNLRLPMIKLGIETGAKLIAFEKPVAMSSTEGIAIKQALDKAGIKAVVSHQHRYGEHYKKVKEIVASGALGHVHTVYGTATGWAAHMLSHLIDYTSWFNNYAPAAWAMGQAAGRGKLADLHTSPDYVAGVVHFQNGVRGIYDCGAGAPDVPEIDASKEQKLWWRKCRMGAQGSEGFAEVLTNGGWRAVTKSGGYQSGPGTMDYVEDMPPYIQEMCDWLDDDKRVHPCAFAHAYQGFEIMAALYRSAAEGGQIALPLTAGVDEIAELKEKVPARKVLFTIPESAKEYPA